MDFIFDWAKVSCVRTLPVASVAAALAGSDFGWPKQAGAALNGAKQQLMSQRRHLKAAQQQLPPRSFFFFSLFLRLPQLS